MLPILVLGEHYGRTPADLWDEAMGLISRDVQDNGHMQRGRTLEEMVIKIVCEREGYTLVALQDVPEEEFLGFIITGHIDAVVMDPKGLLVVMEIKCPASTGFRRIQASGADQSHVCQASWYAMAKRADRAEIFVWSCDDWDYLKFVVPRSDKLESLMRDRAYEFAQAVITGVRPGSDGNDQFADAGNMIPTIGQRKIPASGRHYSIISEIATLTGQRDFIDEQISKLRVEIMGIWPADCKALTTPDGSVTLSDGRKVTTTDMKRAQKDHPEIEWSSYQKTTQGSPFVSYRPAKKDDE